MRNISRFVLFALIVLTIGPAGLAQEGRLPAPVPPALYERAARGGKIPVIVALDAAFTRESLLGTAEARAQRAALTAMRRDLLGKWTGKGIKLRSGSDDWMVPYVALWVNARGLRKLERTPGILSIIEDVPSTPSLNSSVGVIDAYEAYNLGLTGLNQTVAVVDTGITAAHPLLAERIAGEICASTQFGSGGLTSLCPNGGEMQTGAGAASSAKCAGLLLCDHGTYTGGIVAGAPFTVGGETLKGIGFGAKLLAVQVFTRSTNALYCGSQTPPCIVAFTADQIEALQKVYDTRGSYNLAAVMLGFNGAVIAQDDCIPPDPQDPRYDIVQTFFDVGVATIVPSGNNGNATSVAAPACIPEAVAVGSTNDARAVSAESNAAAGLLDLLAVGEGVRSASGVIDIVEENGTSAAAAHVAGAWAILKQVRPSAPVGMILDAFQSTGIDVVDGRNGQTFQFIQIGEAIKALEAGAPVLTNTILNAGFETGTPVANWKLKGSGATRLCIPGDPRIYAGNCAVQLKSTGATSYAKQTLIVDGAAGDFVWLGAQVNTHKAKGTISAKFVGSGGHKLKLKLVVSGSGTYHLLSIGGTLKTQVYDVTVKLAIETVGGGSYEADALMLWQQDSNASLR